MRKPRTLDARAFVHAFVHIGGRRSRRAGLAALWAARLWRAGRLAGRWEERLRRRRS
ncbi:hypothetical protein ABZ726_07850 [Streptomyces hundungensis]|uniref:hypothetical protein n=1 Tax=Streptomyces hundungensis TaxID=1077946 RepID=UPI0033FAFE47